MGIWNKFFGAKKPEKSPYFPDSEGPLDLGFVKKFTSSGGFFLYNDSSELVLKNFKEISKIIEKQYDRAIELLKKSKGKLKQLAERLLEKEVIFKDDLENILGKRPFKTNNEKIEEAKALVKKK